MTIEVTSDDSRIPVALDNHWLSGDKYGVCFEGKPLSPKMIQDAFRLAMELPGPPPPTIVPPESAAMDLSSIWKMVDITDRIGIYLSPAWRDLPETCQMIRERDTPSGIRYTTRARTFGIIVPWNELFLGGVCERDVQRFGALISYLADNRLLSRARLPGVAAIRVCTEHYLTTHRDEDKLYSSAGKYLTCMLAWAYSDYSTDELNSLVGGYRIFIENDELPTDRWPEWLELKFR